MLGSGRVFWLYWHCIDLNFKDCSAAGFCWNTDSITEFHEPQESSSSKCPWFFLCVQRLATKRDALKPIIAEKLKHNRVLSWAWQSAMYNWKPMESLQSHLKISCQAAFGVCKLVLGLPTKNASAKTNQWQHTAPAAAEDQPVGANDVDVDDLTKTYGVKELVYTSTPQDRLVLFFKLLPPKKCLTMAAPTLIHLASWWVESKLIHQDWLDIHHPPAISKGFDFLVGVNHHGWLHGYIQHDVGCQHHLHNLKISTRCDTLPETNSILTPKNGWL